MVTDITLARAAHVLAVVLWIGGVGMVTTVLLPAIRRSYPTAQRLAAFHALEARFATQARVTTAIAGISGFYMTWRLDLWERFLWAEFWWMHAMVLTWLLFTAMLFVIEPLFLEAELRKRAALDPERTFRLVEWLHRVMLGLSLLTIAAVVAGIRGVNILTW